MEPNDTGSNSIKHRQSCNPSKQTHLSSYNFSPHERRDNSVRMKDYFRAREILANGQDINTKDKYGKTLLFNACWRYDEAEVEFLLENGADPNLSWSDGATPLLLAVCLNDHITVRLLVRHGADANAPCSPGVLSPLDGFTAFLDEDSSPDILYVLVVYAIAQGDLETLSTTTRIGSSAAAKPQICIQLRNYWLLDMRGAESFRMDIDDDERPDKDHDLEIVYDPL